MNSLPLETSVAWYLYLSHRRTARNSPPLHRWRTSISRAAISHVLHSTMVPWPDQKSPILPRESRESGTGCPTGYTRPACKWEKIETRPKASKRHGKSTVIDDISKKKLFLECAHKKTEFRCSFLGYFHIISQVALGHEISEFQICKVARSQHNALPYPSSLRWEAQAACWLPVMAKRPCPRLQNVRIPTSLPQMVLLQLPATVHTEIQTFWAPRT